MTIAVVAAGFAVSRPNRDAASEANPHANLALDQPLGDVDTMIARLELRLKGDPSDVAGWRMLGWSRLQTGRPADAVIAYERAVALAPDDAATWSSLGDAHLAAADTAKARTAFARALALDPKDPTARYSLAAIKAQAGNRKGAVEDWLAMLDDAPPGAEWAGEVRAKALSVAGEIGMDISARLPDDGGAVPAIPGTDRGADRVRLRFAGWRATGDDRRNGRAPRRAARGQSARCRGLDAADARTNGAGPDGRRRDARSSPGWPPSPTTRRHRRGCAHRRERSNVPG